MHEIEEVQQLRDQALIERLAHSVRRDRQWTVRLLVEMGEVQVRGLYRDLGFSSMFEFATRKLGMSEAEAGLRLRAAKVGRSFPIALEMLARSEVNLTTLSLLAPVLTQDSLDLLYAARFKSKQEVMELIARHAPKPDAPDSVRRLPPPRPSARAPQRAPTPLGAKAQSCSGAAMTAASPGAPAPSSSAVVPLSAERHKISFTASERVRDLLREAQDLRRHRYPAGDLEPLFERALELVIAEEKKRRFAHTTKPRVRAVKPSLRRHSRYIPNAVRRQVWQRHDGRCCFVAADGQRCEARSRLEFHHVIPFARGGPSTDADNIVIMCRTHNALEADRDFGRTFMRRRVDQRVKTSERSRRKNENASIAKQLEESPADEKCRAAAITERRSPPLIAAS